MYVKETFLKRKFKSLIWMIFCSLENNGVASFEKNGESKFIDELFKYFMKKTNGIVLFDIGANVGEYSRMLHDKAIKTGLKFNIHLFEPTKDCFAEINNKLSFNNITKNNFGISNKNCQTEIYYDIEKSGLASLYKRNFGEGGVTFSKSEMVTLKRMDEYIHSNQINHINFVKIDIEGHEIDAFNGFGEYLNGDFVDFIQFEYGGANLDSHTSLKELYGWLTSKGFVIAKIMQKGLEIRPYRPYMENFNYANYIAISNHVIG